MNINKNRFNVSTFYLVSLAMFAFAGNSVLCRQALLNTSIDPVFFTLVRLVSGAFFLWLLLCFTRRSRLPSLFKRKYFVSSLFLFLYAFGFSLSYRELSTGAGALILFGCVQVTMITYGLLGGEKLSPLQVIGMLLALAGLLVITLNKYESPAIIDAAFMAVAGLAWGIYSILGRQSRTPTTDTAFNFIASIPLALIAGFIYWNELQVDEMGIIYALASGIVTSGMGYAIWYAVLPKVKSTTAATVQLSVPMLAALGGVIFIGEAITYVLVMASLLILGGIYLVLVTPKSTT